MTAHPTDPNRPSAAPAHRQRGSELKSAAAAVEEAGPREPTAPASPPWGDDGEAGRAAHYGRKALQGVKLMLGRQVLIQLFTFAGGIILARTLTPEIFGIFGISMFLVNTLALLGDFGLAPSLVQRKDELTERDLQVAFTLQQGLLTAVAVAIWIAAPHSLRLYPDLGGAEIVWLIRMMALTLFLQSWRSMSVLQMERHLNFKKVAGIEIVEAFSYQGLAVGLALAGFGVWSLVWATLARGLFGAALAFVASPWHVRLAWDGPKAKEILRFGMPFQAGKIIHKTTEWLTPVLVGSMLGPAAVGFVTWASANGRKPTVLIGALHRVAFPHFSRIQDTPERIRSVFDAYLVPLLALFGFWVGLLAATAEVLVPLVFTDKWAPAIPLLILFSIQLPVLAIVQLTTNVLRATGRVLASSSLTAVGSATEIALALGLIGHFGVNAIPVAAGAAMTISTCLKIQLLPFRSAQLLLKRLLQTSLLTTAGIVTGRLLLSIHGPVILILPMAMIASSTVMALTAVMIWPTVFGAPLVRFLKGGSPEPAPFGASHERSLAVQE